MRSFASSKVLIYLTFLIAFSNSAGSNAYAASCPVAAQLGADYLNQFDLYESSTTAALVSVGQFFASTNAEVKPWEGNLVRVPMDQFDRLAQQVNGMVQAITDWTAASTALDDAAYRIEEAMTACAASEPQLNDLVLRHQSTMAEERILENQLIGFMEASVQSIRTGLATWQSWEGVELVIPANSFAPIGLLADNSTVLGTTYLLDLFRRHRETYSSLLEQIR